jgi:hypothetical protein
VQAQHRQASFQVICRAGWQNRLKRSLTDVRGRKPTFIRDQFKTVLAPDGQGTIARAPGYAEYLDAISDPAHPEHENMRLWGPERFDPNVVDRAALEAAVNALSETWKPRRRTTRSK